MELICGSLLIRTMYLRSEFLAKFRPLLHPSLSEVHSISTLVNSTDHPDAQVVMVHSGSQANGLAIQLARAQTGATDVIVFEHSFHGRYIFDNLRTVYDRKEHFSLTSVSCSLSESSACSTVLKETQEPWVNTIMMLFLLIIILILLFKGSCTSCSRPLPRCPP